MRQQRVEAESRRAAAAAARLPAGRGSSWAAARAAPHLAGAAAAAPGGQDKPSPDEGASGNRDSASATSTLELAGHLGGDSRAAREELADGVLAIVKLAEGWAAAAAGMERFTARVAAAGEPAAERAAGAVLAVAYEAGLWDTMGVLGLVGQAVEAVMALEGGGAQQG